jgi:hypothetical protein
MVKPFLSFCLSFYELVDRGWAEWAGPYGLVRLSAYFSGRISSMQNGFLSAYIVSIFNVFFLMFIVSYLLGK